MNTPDNFDLWEARDIEQSRQLARYPKCCHCEDPIQQEDAVCIDDDWYCDRCLYEFRQETVLED